jgi:pimeloyl-ACP methyl ester carboxylesterase
MVNALWADPLLRRNYQVLVFSYPTGYPVPYSALLLRRELDALDRVHPELRRMIVVGHSMGGILTRLMISDSGGDKFWRELFGKSPAETPLPEEAKALLKEGLIFKPRRDVAQVVFISTPHRGSVIAQDAIGRLASSIIRRPARFAGVGAEVLTRMIVQQDPTALKLKRLPNSIDTLAPNSPFVRIMNTLPLAKAVPYHSIIGDRGRGDTPRSSDGVVPYWSSHLDGAESEKIVPSGHGATTNPEAIAEVMRILKQQITGRDLVRKRLRLRGAETRYNSPSAHGSRNRTIVSN